MVRFLGNNEEFELRQFIMHELGYKYNMQIQVSDAMIVTGMTGNDTIVEALKVSFIPANASVEWVEDKIASDIHKFCYEHDIRIVRSPVILRDVFNGDIIYNWVYTAVE